MWIHPSSDQMVPSGKPPTKHGVPRNLLLWFTSDLVSPLLLMELPRPARPVLLAILLLSMAAHSTQITYDEFLDNIESVLNGSKPLGKIDSMLFTQANQYNLATSNKARAKSASHRSPFRSNSIRGSSATDPGVGSSSGSIDGNNGGSGSGSSGSSVGLVSRFFGSFLGVRTTTSATTSGFPIGPPLSTYQNGVKWLSSSAAGSKSNRAKLNMLLKLLGQPSLDKALGKKQSAFFIPSDANVTLEAAGVTNLTAAQDNVPSTVPTPAQVSGQSYAMSYSESYAMDSGTVGVLEDDEERHGGRQYRIECHEDEEEDDDEPICVEPVGRVRIIKYTSPQNISYVLLRAISKCLPDVRKVQIRNAVYGKTGKLVLEMPGSWTLVDPIQTELVKHTLIANASSVIVANGQTLEKAVITMTQAPWNYYAIFTTGAKKNGAIRGQLWKPFCPWCANFTFTGT
ncbi:unnamed protein product [Closterium sp. Yama58-4]|nr:unnamed protein product [Closterium sp. Yama58-4]